MNRLQIIVTGLIVAAALMTGCARSPQARRDKYFARGLALLEKKDPNRAILEFQNAARALPSDPESYYQLGKAFISVGDLRSGIMALRKALELNPKHRNAQLTMSELLSATADPTLLKDAQARLRALLDENPATPDILNTLGFTELKLGNFESAAQAYERILAQSPTEANATAMLARAKLMQNDVKGAEAVLQKAVAVAPQSSAPLRILAEFYIERNRMAEAETHLRKATAINSSDGAVLMDLARLELTVGRKQDAEQSFRRLATFKGYKPIYGIFLLEEGRRDEGVQEFERLARENPDDRGARMRLLVAYRMVKRHADAERVVEEVLKKNPRDIDALIQRGEMLLDGGKYPEAEESLNRAMKLQPTSPELHYLRAKLHKLRRSPLQYRQELAETLRLNPLLAGVRVEYAQELIAAGDAKGALSLLDEAPAGQKEHPAIVLQRNWTLWAKGDLAQMRQSVDAAMAAGRTADLLVQDGLLKLRMGDAAGARAAAEQALKVNPAAVPALHVLGRTYAAQRKLLAGLEKVKEYAKDQPNSAPVQHFLGLLSMGMGDYASARAALMGARSADPGFTAADFALAQLDTAERKLHDAKMRLEAIVTRDASNTLARKWLGNIEELRGDHGAAIAHFRKALERDGADPQVANNLAYLLIEHRKEIDEALKYAQKAVELAPDEPAYLDTLGWALYQKGQYSAAIRYLERASAKSQNAAWKYHLAMAYTKGGDPAKGRTTLAAARKLNATAPEAAAAEAVVGRPD